MIKKNLLFSTITTLSRLISGFFLMFILARCLTVNNFGIFTYSFVFANLLVLMVEFGYNLKLSKDTARNVDAISIITFKAVKVKLFLFIIVLIVLAILKAFEYPDPFIYKILFVLTISSVFNSFANHFLIPYRSINRFDVEAKYVFLNNILLFGSAFLIAYTTKNVFYLALAFLGVKILYSISTIHRFISDFGIKNTYFNLLTEFKNTLPFAIHIAIGSMYLNVDTIILKEYISNVDIGIYQAGMRALGAATIGLGIISTVLVPKLSLLANKTYQLKRISTQFNLMILFIGLFICIVVNIFSKELILLVYGEKYLRLNDYVFLFSIIIFLRYFGVVYGILLTISDNQKIRTYGVALTLIFIIVVDFLIIPMHKIYGALYTLIAAHIFLNIIYIYFAFKEYKSCFLNIIYVK